ncbi:UV-endonuclease UvdE [Leucogyrophana mollusca]|uniref:UV-endonuclease UvdE n=1 Tax=Leucogyrophana mollusca TaxID=85980 RepID=A0ACB8BPU9_9AGAM|nr:UV-endonuclease UvdE [Leucogyrophana mollusca]
MPSPRSISRSSADVAISTVAEATFTSVQQKRTLRPRRVKVVPGPLAQEDETRTPSIPNSRRKTAPKREAESTPGSNTEDEEDSEGSAAPSRRTKPKKRNASQIEVDQASYSSEDPPKRKRKIRAPKPEPVYVIPDVERKETTFHGRLGYACLNTVLRNKRPASEATFCSRTCRIDSIKKNGLDWVKDLGRQNVQDMLQLIEWNEQNNIRFMRISSEMFPFASHETYGYSLTYCASLLAEVGALAKKYGHRLTTHPGQFTQLGSPREAVVRASIRELEYHCQMLDLMGIGPDGVMIIHGGGVYGDKAATLQRIKKTIQEDLPKGVRDRLVLENDELCYNAADLLPLCTELSVPLVFDYHHDNINPSPGLPPASIIEQANKIFAARGIKPKQHLSEPREGAVSVMERRAHADRCQSLPNDLPDDMDLMIEAKDKEQAVLHLYRMYNLHPVIYCLLPKSKLKKLKDVNQRGSPSPRKRMET